MKSVIFSSVLIIIIIIMLVFFSYYTKDTANTLSEILSQFYKTDSVSENVRILENFKTEWKKRKSVLSCFVSHKTAETIDEVLAELEAYISQNAKAEAVSRIARLEIYLSAFSQNDALTIQNVL